NADHPGDVPSRLRDGRDDLHCRAHSRSRESGDPRVEGPLGAEGVRLLHGRGRPYRVSARLLGQVIVPQAARFADRVITPAPATMLPATPDISRELGDQDQFEALIGLGDLVALHNARETALRADGE